MTRAGPRTSRLRPRAGAAFVITSLVLIVAGDPVGEVWGRSSRCPRTRNVANIINNATVLYLSGLAVAIGFRMNLFNIGVDGQYRVAAFTAAVVAGEALAPGLPQHRAGHPRAMAVGAVWAGIAGMLRATRGVSEVISTIMLNAIATGLVAYLCARSRSAWRAATTSAPRSPGGQPDPCPPVRRPARHRALRLPHHRGVLRFPVLVRAQQDPVRLRPPRHRPLRPPQRSRAASTSRR